MHYPICHPLRCSWAIWGKDLFSHDWDLTDTYHTYTVVHHRCCNASAVCSMAFVVHWIIVAIHMVVAPRDVVCIKIVMGVFNARINNGNNNGGCTLIDVPCIVSLNDLHAPEVIPVRIVRCVTRLEDSISLNISNSRNAKNRCDKSVLSCRGNMNANCVQSRHLS